MQLNQQGYWVVIPAAGVGNRFSQERPKQYWTVHNKAILQHTVDLFLAQDWLSGVVVAVAEGDSLIKQLPLYRHSRVMMVQGGATRAQSVLAALKHLQSHAKPQDWMLVHDAVRPCLDERDLLSLRQLSQDPVGGILATPAADTLKKVSPQHEIQQTINRTEIWLAQTPQMFRFELLLQALVHAEQAKISMTDEASAVEALGFCPRVVRAQFPNPKLTYAADLAYIESLLATACLEEFVS